eukprot:TRINITY_DN776105_c0_g1_i1.p1 TRINITY_DN776105_c0_g1~~TRINITY_DN776105_c0_g1_i1.p1  ORF type:complete len:370 (-),score=145.56 TRINITY_DN776105_c0_g1_i1:212-1321(-)
MSVVGAGSVWNANSWHWEEKNYSKWAEKQIRSELLNIFTKTDQCAVKIADVKELKVDASVNIRKGKKTAMTSISFKCEWQGEMVESKKKASGELSVDDVFQDDIMDEDYEINCSLKGVTSHGRILRECFTKSCCPQVSLMFKKFLRDLFNVDGGARKLAEDREKRKMEAEKMAKGVEEKQEEKDALMKKAIEQEKLRKQKQAEEAAKLPIIPPKAHIAEGTGSVWNPNSYHWEEKNVDKWAKDHLTEMLTEVELDIPAGRFVIADLSSVKGEASMNIRRGKKIVYFDYEVKAQWRGDMFDGDGNIASSIIGTLEMPEFSSDEAPDWEVKLILKSENTPANRRTYDIMRKQGVKELRVLLSKFFEELKAK